MTIQVVNDTQPGPSQEQSAQILGAVIDPTTPETPVQWMSAGHMVAEYTYYAIQTTYQTDLGLQAAPSTASRPPGQPNVNQIVRVRLPITYKIVFWTAQRLYVKPVLPHWKTNNPNEKLLSRTISARNPLQSLNHKTWEVTGQYVYAFKKEPFITVDTHEYFVLPAGKTTAENSNIPVALHAFTQEDFSIVPIDSSWIPVDGPLPGATRPPIGYNGRTWELDRVISGAPREGPPGNA